MKKQIAPNEKRHARVSKMKMAIKKKKTKQKINIFSIGHMSFSLCVSVGMCVQYNDAHGWKKKYDFYILLDSSKYV